MLSCIFLVSSTVVLAFAATEKYVANVVTANNEFASELLQQARSSSTLGNAFLSPYSIMTSLGMLAAGARGETELEIRKAMHLKGLSSAKVARALGQLARISKEEEVGYTLAVANRVWAQLNHQLDKTFLQSMAYHFRSPVGRLDFAQRPEISRRNINDWVANRTGGEISELLPSGSVDPLTRLILTNAIYFQGKWVSKFGAKDTKLGKFYGCDCGGSCDSRSVTMMHQYGMFNYKYDPHNSVRVLEMPYLGVGVSMFVLLPDDCQALAILEKGLTAQRIANLTSGLRSTNIDVHFPRFQMSSHMQLNEILKEMGITKAFDPNQADLSGIDKSKNMYVSQVIHQATVNVTEEGTKASASTTVLIAARTFSRPEFRANRAFVFLIVDQRTRAVLFIGRVVNPRTLSGEERRVEGRLPKETPTEGVNFPIKESLVKEKERMPKQCVKSCPIRRSLILPEFCRRKYNYVIVGELVGIHELQSRLRYQLHITRVLQSGSSRLKPQSDQNYLWPKNLYMRCGCGLRVGQKYIIAGHENHKDTKKVLKMDSYVMERGSMRDAVKMRSYIRACKNM